MVLADIGDFLRNTTHALKGSALKVHTLTGSTADSTDSRAGALLRRVNTLLMVFDNKLYALHNGQWASIAESPDAQDLSQNQTDSITQAPPQRSLRKSATDIAESAARLLQVQGGDNNTAPSHNILLCLAPSEFLAAPVRLPGLAPSAVKAALQLQSSTWLPAFDDALSIAVRSRRPPGEVNDLALYFPASRLNALFAAFRDHGLFLGAVMPRPLLLTAMDSVGNGNTRNIQVYEQDTETVSCTVVTAQSLNGFMQTARSDLENEVLAESWVDELAQWQRPASSVSPQDSVAHRINSAQGYLDHLQTDTELINSEQLRDKLCDYAFFPPAALAAGHLFDRGKRLWMAAAVIGGIALLGTLPFLLQSVQIRSLQASVEEQRLLSAPARENQAVVRDFEQQWGVINEFPRQDVPAVLLTLQSVINPNVLLSMEINEGYISIEGESEDPQNLLQQLEQNALFTEVDFARATNNNRYYIDLRLTHVNFPTWQEWYFPERR